MQKALFTFLQVLSPFYPDLQKWQQGDLLTSGFKVGLVTAEPQLMSTIRRREWDSEGRSPSPSLWGHRKLATSLLAKVSLSSELTPTGVDNSSSHPHCRVAMATLVLALGYRPIPPEFPTFCPHLGECSLIRPSVIHSNRACHLFPPGDRTVWAGYHLTRSDCSVISQRVFWCRWENKCKG